MPDDVVWFMGPVNGPGFRLLRSTKPGIPENYRGNQADSSHRPPNFPWKSMDRKWHPSHMPQGYTAMNWRLDWSVLSVTDYTQDSRPNVMVSFAVNRPKVQEPEMRALAEERYGPIWRRLNVREEMWSEEDLR